MRILVTGGTGFVGSHIVQAAMSKGHDVVVLARNGAKVGDVFAALGAPEPDIVVGDATNAADVATAVNGCDAVVHAAAVVAMGRHDSDSAHDNNTVAGQCVLSAASAAGCAPIIHVSSVSVLGLSDDPMTVDSPLRKAASGYSRSKSDLEVFARGMQAAGAPVVTTYPAGVFGPNAPSLTPVHTAAQTWLRAAPVLPSGINIVDVRDLAAFVAERRIPALFVESSVSPRSIEAVLAAINARGFAAKIGGSLFSDALGDAKSGADTYETMILHNVNTMVEALGGGSVPGSPS